MEYRSFNAIEWFKLHLILITGCCWLPDSVEALADIVAQEPLGNLSVEYHVKAILSTLGIGPNLGVYKASQFLPFLELRQLQYQCFTPNQVTFKPTDKILLWASVTPELHALPAQRYKSTAAYAYSVLVLSIRPIQGRRFKLLLMLWKSCWLPTACILFSCTP